MTRQLKLILWTAIGVVVAAVAAVAVLVVANHDGKRIASRPLLSATVTSGCVDKVIIYFRTDEEMTAAAEKLLKDRQVMLVRTETKAEAYKRFKEIFADHPELVDLARPEALPASTMVRPVQDVDSERLADRLREDFQNNDDVQILPCQPR